MISKERVQEVMKANGYKRIINDFDEDVYTKRHVCDECGVDVGVEYDVAEIEEAFESKGEEKAIQEIEANTAVKISQLIKEDREDMDRMSRGEDPIFEWKYGG